MMAGKGLPQGCGLLVVGHGTADRVGDRTARKAAKEHPDEHARGDRRLPGGVVARTLQNGPSAEHLDRLGGICETQGAVH